MVTITAKFLYLHSTIVRLAQNFVGSNNINLLEPIGQFGTRHDGGKKEGMKIEPKWYIPIIPMVLVNGAEGIGMGWNTSIPNFNPTDIIKNL